MGAVFRVPVGQENARGRSKLYRVWLRQDRLCSACQKPITKLTPWDVHYYVKKIEAGRMLEATFTCTISVAINHQYAEKQVCNRVLKDAFVEA